MKSVKLRMIVNTMYKQLNVCPQPSSSSFTDHWHSLGMANIVEEGVTALKSR